MAKERGAAHIDYKIADLYYRGGEGVLVDYEKARIYYEYAYESNDSSAGLWLGIIYSEGRGVEKDLAKAEGYLLFSAEKGNASAILRLAELYEGLRDYKNALVWYTKAAEDESRWSKMMLEKLFSKIQTIKDMSWQ